MRAKTAYYRKAFKYYKAMWSFSVAMTFVWVLLSILLACAGGLQSVIDVVLCALVAWMLYSVVRMLYADVELAKEAHHERSKD